MMLDGPRHAREDERGTEERPGDREQKRTNVDRMSRRRQSLSCCCGSACCRCENTGGLVL